MPTMCCLHKCNNLEELYLEKADSSAITTYLLAHTLKHLNCVRVLALPKQCKKKNYIQWISTHKVSQHGNQNRLKRG